MKTHTLALLFGLSILLAGLALSAAAADDLKVKWSYGMNNTAKAVVLSVKVADFDGDGWNDVAVGAKEDRLEGSAGWVYLLNNDGTLKWEKDTPGAVSAMTTGNLSGGTPTIIAGVSSRIYLFDGTGDSKQVSLGDLTYKATTMVVDDINNDGAKELVVSGGSQDKGKVFVYDKDGRLPYSASTMGSPSAMIVSDINGDGLKEIIVGTVGRDKEYPAYIQAFSPKGDSLWQAYKTKKGVQSLAVLDIDGDGSPEILAGSTDSLYVLSSEGKEKDIKSNITRQGFVFNRILVTDLDNNGEEEVVFGCTNTVYVYDKTLTNLKWKNPVGTAVFDLDAEDIDGDGFKELAVASDILYVFNKDGTLVNSFNANTPRFSVRDIYIGDINYDTYPEIIIGATDGKIYVLGSNSQSKKMDANNLYKRGKDQYAERNYVDAEKSIRSAMTAYKDLGDNTKAQEIYDLLKKIMNEEAKVANQSVDAQTYLDNAYGAFQDRDYLKAIENARIAKAKYMNINPKDPNIKSSDTIINSSTGALRFAAENYLDNATTYSKNKDYENALQYAKKAAESYAFLSDDANLAKSQAIINASKQALGITDETTNEQQPAAGPDLSSVLPILAGLALIIILALITGYALKNRKKTKKTEPEDNVLDMMEKERPKEKKKESHEHRHTTHEEPKQWIKEVDEAMKEPRKQEKTDAENKETNPAHQAHKHRKTLKRITKDNYRGEGISLRNLSCAPSEDDIRD